jgi:hypothetical protein
MSADSMFAIAAEGTAERRLWVAVLLQAFNDAVYGGGCGPVEQSRAQTWLTTPSEHFNLVCALCELEPDRVRALAIKCIANPPKRSYQGNRSPRKRNQTDRGVVENFSEAKGTGAGRTPQDQAELEFS